MKVSADLREKFHAAQTPEGPRTIRVNIKAETLVYHSEKKNTGDINADFSAITSDVTDTKPAFYLFNRAAGTADTKSWGLIAYVPEMAAVSGSEPVVCFDCWTLQKNVTHSACAYC